MKTKFISQCKLIVLFLFFSMIQMHAQNQYFLPDEGGLFISQFDLKNGDQVRGFVVRMVFNTYYEVQLGNGDIVIVREEDIAKKKKVKPDMRENKVYYELGIAGSSMIRQNEDFTALFLHGSFAKEFGRDNKFFASLEVASGRIFWNSDDFTGDINRPNNFGKVGLGYNFNRMETFSQAFSIGGLMYYREGDYYPYLYFQCEFPIKIKPNTLITPYVTYLTPFDGFDYGNSLYLAGLKFRFYMPSSIF